jgi:hypothetical protein
MKQIYKEYAGPFLLEPTKLTRLIDTIHQRLADYPHLSTHDHFEAFLTGDRRDEMTTLEARELTQAQDQAPGSGVVRFDGRCSSGT